MAYKEGIKLDIQIETSCRKEYINRLRTLGGKR